MKTALQTFILPLLTFLTAACDQNAQMGPQSVTKPDAPAAGPIRYHALVIGISDYANTGWPTLSTASDDARAIGNLLQTQYGFDVIELIDQQATRGNILRSLDRLMSLTKDDALLIYYAGHGYYDRQMDEGYWIPSGAQRERQNLPAKEDWLWNSSINRILNALPARHVLLMADTCYGGALFRGEEISDKPGNWYARALTVPSRYLITSGNLEPVLDSGIRHSVFAQEILNYLQYTDRPMFSASDIAISIRTKVSELTGQLVRMGPLASPAHAGGEFVFVRNNTTCPLNNETPPETNLPKENQNRGPAEELAARLETYSRSTSPESFVRPRVLACLGPNGGEDEIGASVRNRLYESLSEIGGCIIVERESLNQILQEVELGQSNLADRRAATQIGKLLPASLILLGELIPVGNGHEIHLRIVDTETSRVLSSDSTSFDSYEELTRACDQLAGEIMQTMNSARPILLQPTWTPEGTLSAGWGRFHGARINDAFEMITRENIGTVSQRDILLGTARIITLNEESSVLLPEWNAPIGTPPADLWLKAMFALPRRSNI